MNPLWGKLKAEESEAIKIHSKGSSNHWKRALIGVSFAFIVLAYAGVPVYDFAVSSESSVIPFDLTGQNIVVSPSPLANGVVGDLIDYELSHWGAKPSIAIMGDIIVDAFSDAGLEYVAYSFLGLAGIEDAAGAILATGIFSDSVIATILLTFSSNPIGWGALIFVASVIIGL